MRSTLLFLLSTLLVTTNLAPLVITIFSQDVKTSVVIDFNEEENKKDEKKEISEKDFFPSLQFVEFTAFLMRKSSVATFYLEGGYTYSIDIFLPPPEHSFFSVA